MDLLEKLKTMCRNIENQAIIYYNFKPRVKCKVKLIDKKEARNTGFAYYRDNVAYFNPVIKHLNNEDIKLIIIHEVVGHHLHPKNRKVSETERCATYCEVNFSRFLKISEKTIRIWKNYIKCRDLLDRNKEIRKKNISVKEKIVIAKNIFRVLPKKYVRYKVEISRVIEEPGTLKYYTTGPKGKACRC